MEINVLIKQKYLDNVHTLDEDGNIFISNEDNLPYTGYESENIIDLYGFDYDMEELRRSIRHCADETASIFKKYKKNNKFYLICKKDKKVKKLRLLEDESIYNSIQIDQKVYLVGFVEENTKGDCVFTFYIE